jgi:hypothetical protein
MVMGREELNVGAMFDEMLPVVQRVAEYHEQVPWPVRRASAANDDQ